MTDIDTSKHARDMTPAERQAFLQQCRKLDAAPPKPVETTTRTARDMSAQERAEWLADYKRSLR
jgi:ribosomal protein L29